MTAVEVAVSGDPFGQWAARVRAAFILMRRCVPEAERLALQMTLLDDALHLHVYAYGDDQGVSGGETYRRINAWHKQVAERRPEIFVRADVSVDLREAIHADLGAVPAWLAAAQALAERAAATSITTANQGLYADDPAAAERLVADAQALREEVLGRYAGLGVSVIRPDSTSYIDIELAPPPTAHEAAEAMSRLSDRSPFGDWVLAWCDVR